MAAPTDLRAPGRHRGDIVSEDDVLRRLLADAPKAGPRSRHGADVVADAPPPATGPPQAPPDRIRSPARAPLPTLLLLCIIAAALGGAVGVARAATPPASVTAEMSFLVTTRATTTEEFAESAFATAMRSKTYSALLTSEAFAQRVSGSLGGRESPGTIRSRITVRSASAPSSVIVVDVRNRGQSSAVALARLVASEFVDLVDEIETPQSGGSPAVTVSVVSAPQLVEHTPDILEDSVTGAIAAVVVVAALCAARLVVVGGFGRSATSRFAPRTRGVMDLDSRRTDVAMLAVAVATAACATASPRSTVLAGAAVVVVCVAVASLVSLRVAWVVFFSAICANGLLFSTGPLTIRPEYLAAPLFLTSLWLNTAEVRYRRGLPLIALGLVGWIGVGVVSSAFVAPLPAFSLRMCVQLIVAVLVFVPMIRRVDSVRFFVVSGSYILGAICVASIGMWFLDGGERLRGLAFEYNVMGAICVGWLGVLLYCSLASDILLPLAVKLTTVPLAVATLLTTTRAAWIGLGVLGLYWIIANFGRRPVTAAAGAVGVAAAGTILFAWLPASSAPSDFWYRLQNLADFAGGTGAYRLDIWSTAMSEIAARDLSALIGSGVLSFSALHPPDLSGLSPYLSSLWIGVVYDSGWIGAVFFGCVLIGIAVAIRRGVHAVPLAMVLALSASFTNIVWFAFPWVFLALVVCAGPTGSRSQMRTPA